MIRLGQSKLYRRYVSWSHLFELTILFFVDMFLIFSLPLFVCQWELREVISGCDQPHQQHLYRIRIWHRYWPRELWQSKSLPHLLDVILWHYSDTCLIQDLILCGFISLTFFFFNSYRWSWQEMCLEVMDLISLSLMTLEGVSPTRNCPSSPLCRLCTTLKTPTCCSSSATT